MKRDKLKKILKNYTTSDSTIRAYLNGGRTPTFKDISSMNRKYKVPFSAWEDIKSYLQDNDTKQKAS